MHDRKFAMLGVQRFTQINLEALLRNLDWELVVVLRCQRLTEHRVVCLQRLALWVYK